MGVVYEKARITGAGELGEVRQAGHVAVHAEDAVCHDIPAAGAVCVSKEAGEGVHIAVGIDGHAGAGDAAAVDETGVVQAVAEDDVSRPGQAVEHAEIRHVSRIEDERCFLAFEPGELPFEVGELKGRAGGEPRAAGASAPPEGETRCFDDGGLVGHAEVVVRVKNERFRAVSEPPSGGALHAEVGDLPVLPPRPDRFERGGDVFPFHGLTSTRTVSSCMYRT